MEYDKAPNNVHALFPGIETMPFGRAAALDELSEEGWSATPERTLVVEDQAGSGRRAAGRPYSPRTAGGCVGPCGGARRGRAWRRASSADAGESARLAAGGV